MRIVFEFVAKWLKFRRKSFSGTSILLGASSVHSVSRISSSRCTSLRGSCTTHTHSHVVADQQRPKRCVTDTFVVCTSWRPVERCIARRPFVFFFSGTASCGGSFSGSSINSALRKLVICVCSRPRLTGRLQRPVEAAPELSGRHFAADRRGGGEAASIWRI